MLKRLLQRRRLLLQRVVPAICFLCLMTWLRCRWSLVDQDVSTIGMAMTNIATKETKQDRKQKTIAELSQKFAVCRQTQLDFQTKSKNDTSESLFTTTTTSLGSTCPDNDLYEAFAKRLLAEAEEFQQLVSLTTWGRPASFLSLMMQQDLNFLMVGSQAVSQLAQTWACQLLDNIHDHNNHTIVLYQDDSDDNLVTRWRLILSNTSQTSSIAQQQTIMTLTVVADAYFPYHPNHWQQLLQDQLTHAFLSSSSKTQISPDHFDALVLGVFRECQQIPTSYGNNNYNRIPSKEDCDRSRTPHISEWVEALEGRHFRRKPIVFLTLPLVDRMYAATTYHWEIRQYLRSQQQQQQNHQSIPILGLVDARRFVDQMLQIHPDNISRKGGGSPRRPCVGPYGSWQDPVVWDVVEFLRVHLTTQDGVTDEEGTEDNSSNTKRGVASSFFDVAPSGRDSSLTCPVESVFLPDRVMCQSPFISPPPLDRLAKPVQVTYWCEGEAYDAFGQHLQDYVNNLSTTSVASQSWGRRPHPVPAAKHVLMVGNSHSRQVASALLCAHATSIDGIVPTSPQGAVRYEFCNNASLSTAFNSHFPYSPNWKSLLQTENDGKPLEYFDAVVLGLFNYCGGNNTFSIEMEGKTARMAEDVDCVRVRPPTVLEWAEAFDGPIIFVSMFANNQRTDRDKAFSHVQALRGPQYNRSNVVFVDGRRHIESMQYECASGKATIVTDCLPEQSPLVQDFSNPYFAAHRCTGAHGGHPDLIAWDVIEHLFTLLSGNSL